MVDNISSVVSESRPESAAYPTPGSALALLTIPYVFTQDKLLTTGELIDQAKERGYELSLDDLQRFHSHRLLVPLYRVSDSPVASRRIPVEPNGGPNARGWTLEAAATGRIRESAEEGYSVAWPYAPPSEENPREWWNGFIYSSWQLLDMDSVISGDKFIEIGWRSIGDGQARCVRDRRLTLVLAALATRYLPAIIGQLNVPYGVDEEGLRQYRAKSDVREHLRLAGFESADLQPAADMLLLSARRDPLIKWLPLVRYSNYAGWSKLSGASLHAMWRRVAAEILLRAHEDLAAKGVVGPLPELSSSFHTAQHDRLTARFPEAETLERALAELGLSPYPKVILLVEGETELYHLPRLLAEFGLTPPQDVRVQRTKSSKINAHLIARYNVAPRVGRRINDRWLLDASLTGLVITMDPENDFATQAQRDDVRRKLQEAIREEVLYQDADISQDELDYLVNIHVWGADKYELANFSDDELVPAITTLATSQQNPRVALPTWEQNLRTELQATRLSHADIKVAMGRMRVREDKVELAKLLWPTLLSKCEAEYASGSVQTSVLKVVLEVRQLIAKLSGVFALMGPGA